MCGICGVINKREHKDILRELKDAMDVQRHCGPDDQGAVAFRFDGTVREAWCIYRR